MSEKLSLLLLNVTIETSLKEKRKSAKSSCMLRSIFLFFVPKINQFSSPLIFVSVQKNPVYYIQYFYFFQRSIDGSIFFLKEWHSEIPSPLIFVSIQKNTKSSILHSIFLLFVPNFLLERMRFPLLLFSFQYKKIQNPVS